MSKSVLFYFPYAGASSMTFNRWTKVFAPEVDFIPIDYAGHGKRRNEKFYLSMEEACYDIYEILKNNVGRYENYYLGGHCIGSVIAFEIYDLIRSCNEFKLPEAIFVSGQAAPNLKNIEQLSVMDNRELLSYLYTNGAIDSSMMDEEIFEYVENFVLAPIKADSLLGENYVFKPKKNLIQSSLHVMYGIEDAFYSAEEFFEWGRFSEKAVKFYAFEGGHYFINEKWKEYTEEIKNLIIEIEKNDVKGLEDR